MKKLVTYIDVVFNSKGDFEKFMKSKFLQNLKMMSFLWAILEPLSYLICTGHQAMLTWSL